MHLQGVRYIYIGCDTSTEHDAPERYIPLASLKDTMHVQGATHPQGMMHASTKDDALQGYEAIKRLKGHNTCVGYKKDGRRDVSRGGTVNLERTIHLQSIYIAQMLLNGTIHLQGAVHLHTVA